MLTVLTQMPPFVSGNSEWTYGHPDGPSRRPFGISQGYFWVRVMSAPKKEVPIGHDRASSHLARPRPARRQPVIRGTRLSVEFVIGLVVDGWSETDILGNYPGISH